MDEKILNRKERLKAELQSLLAFHRSQILITLSDNVFEEKEKILRMRKRAKNLERDE